MDTVRAYAKTYPFGPSSPTDLHGIDAVRSVWTSFFEMFDEVHLSEIEFEEISASQAKAVAGGRADATPPSAKSSRTSDLHRR
jgi:hypothetical protein